MTGREEKQLQVWPTVPRVRTVQFPRDSGRVRTVQFPETQVELGQFRITQFEDYKMFLLVFPWSVYFIGPLCV